MSALRYSLPFTLIVSMVVCGCGDEATEYRQFTTALEGTWAVESWVESGLSCDESAALESPDKTEFMYLGICHDEDGVYGGDTFYSASCATESECGVEDCHGDGTHYESGDDAGGWYDLDVTADTAEGTCRFVVFEDSVTQTDSGKLVIKAKTYSWDTGSAECPESDPPKAEWGDCLSVSVITLVQP